MKRSYFLIYLSPSLLACLAIGLVMYMREGRRPGGDVHASGVDTYREVVEIIESEHVEEIPREDLIYGAVKGMTDVLDRHSRGYTPEEWRAFESASEGRSHGIGVHYGPLQGALHIYRVVPGSPAARGGLRAGDRILSIDGSDIPPDASASAVKERIVGEAGKAVKFRVSGWESDEVREAVVVRGSYKRETVFWQRVGPREDLLYIRVSGFNLDTGSDFRRVLRERRERDVRGIIMDLRDNPGGSLPESVSIVAAFLESPRVLTSVSREGSRRYATEDPVLEPETPLAVLMDGSSASASEIVAGALQDYKRGLIVGDRSYGKGLVQKIFALRSRPSGVKITTSRWLTPSGRSLQRDGDDTKGRGGVEPDLHVALSRDEVSRVRVSWDRLGLDPFMAEALALEPTYAELLDGFEDRQLGAAIAAFDGQPPVIRVEP